MPTDEELTRQIERGRRRAETLQALAEGKLTEEEASNAYGCSVKEIRNRLAEYREAKE